MLWCATGYASVLFRFHVTVQFQQTITHLDQRVETKLFTSSSPCWCWTKTKAKTLAEPVAHKSGQKKEIRGVSTYTLSYVQGLRISRDAIAFASASSANICWSGFQVNLRPKRIAIVPR